jgi:hypothetical protein
MSLLEEKWDRQSAEKTRIKIIQVFLSRLTCLTVTSIEKKVEGSR